MSVASQVKFYLWRNRLIASHNGSISFSVSCLVVSSDRTTQESPASDHDHVVSASGSAYKMFTIFFLMQVSKYGSPEFC